MKDYCAGLQVELTGWKAKVYDVVRKLDKMESRAKEKVVPQVNELHIIIEELTDRIERLNAECSTQYGPDKIESGSKVDELKLKWEGAWENVSPADIGG